MIESTKSILSGLKYTAIAAKTAGIAVFNKDASQKYLLDTLGSIPGISAKAAQLLTMKLKPDSSHQIEAMPLSLVKQIIDRESPQLARRITVIEEDAKVASLGQVHRAQLDDGKVVAIKVQYPGVEAELSAQFSLIKTSANFGPPKKFKLAIDELSQYFEESVLAELNYLEEAKIQTKFKKLTNPQLNVTIPEVYMDLCSEKVLVQSYENSMQLDVISKFWPKEAHRECAKLFMDFFLRSCFENGLIHSDPHPQNYGFRTATNPKDYHHELVLYDFGSTLRITPLQMQTIYQLISYRIQDKDINPFDYLVFLGFDPDKLKYIHDKLPALLDKILAPFTTPGAFKIGDWHLQEHFDLILGEDKWWFRTAGPAWFLMFMRAMQGIMFFLDSLDQGIAIQHLFKKIKPLGEIDIPHQTGFEISTDSLSKKLFVLVLENKKEVVRLTMPARSVDDLENLMPQDTKDRIEEQGIDILELKKQAQKSGYTPQVIFETTAGNREYKVWLK